MVQLLSVLVIGGGIGWLSGLSISPVIGTVLASLVGVAGGVVVGVRSVARKRGEGPSTAPTSVDARLAAVLVVGISLAAPFGIIARTHGMFERALPVQTGQDEQGKSNQSTLRSQGVLFGIPVETCTRLRALAQHPNERAFRDALASSGDWARLVEQGIAETATLRAIVEDLCAK